MSTRRRRRRLADSGTAAHGPVLHLGLDAPERPRHRGRRVDDRRAQRRLHLHRQGGTTRSTRSPTACAPSIAQGRPLRGHGQRRHADDRRRQRLQPQGRCASWPPRRRDRSRASSRRARRRQRQPAGAASAARRSRSAAPARQDETWSVAGRRHAVQRDRGRERVRGDASPAACARRSPAPASAAAARRSRSTARARRSPSRCGSAAPRPQGTATSTARRRTRRRRSSTGPQARVAFPATAPLRLGRDVERSRRRRASDVRRRRRGRDRDDARDRARDAGRLHDERRGPAC